MVATNAVPQEPKVCFMYQRTRVAARAQKDNFRTVLGRLKSAIRDHT